MACYFRSSLVRQEMRALVMIVLFALVQSRHAYQRSDPLLANDHPQTQVQRDLIIDGIETIPGRYPYMASMASQGSHRCGGTVS